METRATELAERDLAPRVLRTREVVQLLGCSLATFHRKRKRFEQRGFPPRSALLGGWHREAVLAWLAAHFGLAAATAAADPWALEASREKLKHVSLRGRRHGRR